ncbi:hypothetical protein Gpo141_00001951 [Globisporangium polare]
MSLTALLSLSSSSKGSSAPTSAAPQAQLLDVYQRVPLQATLRRNEHGALKPQQLHFKLYGTNTKSRYRSLLAGFSVDVVEHFDRLRALNEAPLPSPSPSVRAINLHAYSPIATSAISLDHNSNNDSANSSSYSNRTSASLPVLLGATSGLYAPQSSLSLFMDSLHFLPAASAASSWRKTPLTITTNNSNGSAVGKPHKPVNCQIELVAMPPRRNQEQPESPRSKSRSKATATVRVHSRPRRTSITINSSASRSPTPSPSSLRGKQSELRRAIRANAQLSSALMNKKLLEATSSVAVLSTASYANQSQAAAMAINDISYEIDEVELANRFYTELKSNDSRETTSNASGASTPPLSPSQHQQIRLMATDDGAADDNEQEENTRETEWKARQLALEQQVAALLAENQAKTALIKYLMDENSRIVGDCECGKAVTSPARQQEPSSPEIVGHEETQHSITYASNGRAQGSHDSSPADNVAMASESPSRQAKAAQVSPIQVPEAKWKLPETGAHSANKQSKQPMAAKETLLFEGLVSEIEAEFSQLFTCECSTESGEVGPTAA